MPVRLTPRVLVRAGVPAGVAAGFAMAAWLMFCGEVANDPTRVRGISSSTWTAITAITAFFFGADAFHGDWAALSILAGLAIHAVASVLFALPGVALIGYTFAGRPGPVGGMLAGLAYGLAVEILALNLAVNLIQGDGMLYESIPSWGWWVGHGFYGTTLGLVCARRLPEAPA